MCDRIEVGPGAEATAGTSENRNSERIVILEAAKHIGKCLRRLTIDCVAHLGTRDGNDRNIVFDFKADEAFHRA